MFTFKLMRNALRLNDGAVVSQTCRRVPAFSQQCLEIFNTRNVSTAEKATTEGQVYVEHEDQTAKDTIQKINKQIKDYSYGRLFAVVQVAGKQFKITAGDLIIVQGTWPPTAGDEISLDKILCVGGKSFSLFGRPMLPAGLASVKATVIEKNLSHTRTHFRFQKRKQYRQINFFRTAHTMLRINTVDIVGDLNNPQSIESLDGKMLQ